MITLPRLNAIVDGATAARAGWSVTDLAAAYLAGGARFLQVRSKDASSADLLASARAVVGLAHRCRGLVVVNDRADIAVLSGADGVHVGQDDLPPAAARRILDRAGAERILGFSTHSEEQLAAARREPLAYVAVGPVFGTTTKATGYDAVGLELVRRAAETGLPVVAIGGITLDNAESVLAAGATSVAVITDLLRTGDPEARAREFVARLGG